MFRKRKQKDPPATTGSNDIVAAMQDLKQANAQQEAALAGARRATWTASELRKVRERNNISPAIRRSILGEA